MTGKQRILFLADINSIHTERWVKSLMAKGFEVGVFSLSAKTRSWMIDLKGFEYQCYGLGNDVVRSKKWSEKLTYFKAIKQVREYCNRYTPDIVHAHYASSYGMLAMRLKFPKSVLSLWGSDVYEFPKRSPLHKWLFKRILRAFPVVCSTSNDMAEEARKYVDKEYYITPFGVDVQKFVPNRKDNQDFIVGTVKTLEDVYGIDRLITVFSKFHERFEGTSRLLIYGSGSKEEELKALTKTLGVESEVEFKGFVDGQDVVAAFNSLDVFVALSRQESFGVAILEAQACGIPVLVSDVGGLPEVTNEKSGVIINGDDIDAGVSALIDYTDQFKRDRMSIEARRFVEENFSEEICVNKMIGVYDQV